MWYGFAVVFLLIVLTALLFWKTDGIFLPAHWVAFYVTVALVTGLLFWMVAGAKGDFQWKEFGISLGGGAAIGMSFMLIAHHITPEGVPPNIRIIDLRIPDVDGIIHPVGITGIAKVIQIDGPRYLVQFDEGEFEGSLTVNYLAKGGVHRQRIYTVRRTGKLPDPVDEEVHN